MNICLIDADSKIPNLALMRLSAFHKAKGSEVALYKANLPYFPNMRRKKFKAPSGYDAYYCSCVFSGTKGFIVGENIQFGGSGCDLKKTLPLEVENCKPDYSLYPDNDCSYGFISRGCIRKCGFCFVPEKEGSLREVASINDIIEHKKVKFLDNNFLALKNHKAILKELVDRQIKCQFNQGLDIRLVDTENSKLLSELNYLGDYLFSFDSLAYLPVIKQKLELLSWRKPFQLKFFVYVSPNMSIHETVQRIEWLKENELLPYIMRDLSCWDSVNKEFYIDIAAYCNQVGIFKKLTFSQFLKKRTKNLLRIEKSDSLYANKIKAPSSNG